MKPRRVERAAPRPRPKAGAAVQVRPALWAPWRMEYILGPKRGDGRCVFCGHARAPRSRWSTEHVLAVSEHAYVCLNRYPFASGHLLVIPKRHVPDLTDLADAEHEDLFGLARTALIALRAALSPEGVNLGANLGAAAGAGIAEHVHLHLVPRWRGDTNFMPVLADVRVLPQHLDATYAALAPHFGLAPGGTRRTARPQRGARGERA